MAALKVPRVYKKDSVLIADDEPEHLEWLVEYLQAKGFKVEVATNVHEAMVIGERTWHRVYIIDLNIPLGGWPEPTNAVFQSYPGLAIIQGIRSQGNDGRRVVAYSAHSNEEITAEMKRLYTDYVAKGRPNQMKDKLIELFAMPDVTAKLLARVESWEQRQQAVREARKKATTRMVPAKSKASKFGARRGRPKQSAFSPTGPKKRKGGGRAP